MHAVYVKILPAQVLTMESERPTLRRDTRQPAKTLSVQNPVQEGMRVQLWGLEKGSYRIDIMTLEGRLIYTKPVAVNADMQSELIPRRGNMITGLHIVSIHDASNKRFTYGSCSDMAFSPCSIT